jgi:hypothetical protein
MQVDIWKYEGVIRSSSTYELGDIEIGGDRFYDICEIINKRDGQKAIITIEFPNE